MRVPFLIGCTANTPRPCTGELRTSTRSEVTIGGPPLVGCGWEDMSMDFLAGMGALLDGHRRLDRRMMLVVHDLEVFEGVVKDAGRAAQKIQLRQCQRHARELLVHLLEVIRIQVAIAPGPDEFAGLELA